MFEIEIRNTLTSWSTRGKRYRPGVFLTEDALIAEDARQVPKHISVRELEAPVEGEKLTAPVVEVEHFEPAGPGTGVLTKNDVKVGNTPTFTCDVEGCGHEFSTEPALKSHKTRYHKPEPVSEPVVEPEEEPVVQDEDADVVFDSIYEPEAVKEVPVEDPNPHMIWDSHSDQQ